MLDRVLSRCRSLLGRVRRFERRELRELWAWLETTRNLVHVSALVLVPVLVALVTKLSNVVGVLPFVLFPPLASGTYTLFANPEGRYASPVRFVGGLTGGAVCGGVALWLSTVVTRPAAGTVDGLATTISPVAAAVAVFLTGAVTWAFEVEEPAAFSTALLALVLPTGAGSGGTPVTVAGQYVLGVAAASTVVAGAFTLWRERFYERRARYLYQSTKGDDHVFVPMRGDHADATAMLGARLAAAHDAGKVVLFDTVDEDAIERAADDLRAEGFDDLDAAAPSPESVDDGASLLRSDDDADANADSLADRAAERAAAGIADDLEAHAGRIETVVGVPCEVVVAVADADPSATVLRTAHETNCDLIVTPFETRHGSLSPYVRDLFRGDTDVLVHRSTGGRVRWRRVLVPVRQPSDVAHAMIDFAQRLTRGAGGISVCRCIRGERERRRAEKMLADLVEPFETETETRVAHAAIEEFLTTTAPQYDLVVIGASRDRSAASQFVSPPTFEHIRDLETDVAILDRNYRV